MIVLGILNLVFFLVSKMIILINIPGAGAQFEQITEFISSMFSNAENLIGFFLPWEIVKFGLPIVIVLVNAEHIYHFTLWVLRKIPMLGIE